MVKEKHLLFFHVPSRRTKPKVVSDDFRDTRILGNGFVVELDDVLFIVVKLLGFFTAELLRKVGCSRLTLLDNVDVGL